MTVSTSTYTHYNSVLYSASLVLALSFKQHLTAHVTARLKKKKKGP